MGLPPFRPLVGAIALAAALALSAACQQSELPGDLVGQYLVTGTLEENSCGETAVPAQNPLSFEVEIRDDKGAGIWAVSEKPFVYGVLGEDGDFLFKQETSYQVELGSAAPAAAGDDEYLSFLSPTAAAEAEPSVCIIIQAETVEGALGSTGEGAQPDAGEDGEQPELEGENLIEFRAAADSDCSGATLAGGGLFLALPCQLRYSLAGELQ